VLGAVCPLPGTSWQPAERQDVVSFASSQFTERRLPETAPSINSPTSRNGTDHARKHSRSPQATHSARDHCCVHCLGSSGRQPRHDARARSGALARPGFCCIRRICAVHPVHPMPQVFRGTWPVRYGSLGNQDGAAVSQAQFLPILWRESRRLVPIGSKAGCWCPGTLDGCDHEKWRTGLAGALSVEPGKRLPDSSLRAGSCERGRRRPVEYIPRSYWIFHS